MNNGPLTPATIGLTTFRVPLYQRPYAWEDAEVRQLLQDLHENFKNAPNDHYHIGILSVSETSDDKSCFDIIDGQQRITTLMLIGKTITKLKYPEKSDRGNWEAFLIPRRLHLYGRTGDQDFLENDTQGACNGKMVAAFDVATAFMKRDSDADFSKYIYENAAFFLAQVPAGYSLMEKNHQFVRMNNRGKQLEKHEILKVQLISRISEQERTSAFAIWNSMADCLMGMKETENGKSIGNGKSLKDILDSQVTDDVKESNGGEALYASIVSIPEFLLIALDRYCHEHGKGTVSHNKDKLIETFQDKFPQGDASNVATVATDIQKFVDVLATQVQLLEKYFIFITKGGGKDDRYKLGRTAVDEDSFGDNPGARKHLIVVQSFLHVSTEPHLWLIPAFDWCSDLLEKKPKEQGADFLGRFVCSLEKIDNTLITNGKRSLKPLGALDDMRYGSVPHYWFYRLDYELWKQYEENRANGCWANLPDEAQRLVRDFRFRPCGSVEHILPQKRMEAQINPEPDHSFGNLALISGSRNSQFGQQTLAGKMELILSSNYTESLKMIHFLWCKPDALCAGTTMYEILKSSVPSS